MATSEELYSEIKWDLDRLPVAVDEHASEAALAVLDELAGQSKTIERVTAYARRDDDTRRIRTDDLLRCLQQADGQLALFTWSSMGSAAVGYCPGPQRFDIGRFSAVDQMMGNEFEFYDVEPRAAAKDELAGNTPDVIHRDDAKLLPDLSEVSP